MFLINLLNSNIIPKFFEFLVKWIHLLVCKICGIPVLIAKGLFEKIAITTLFNDVRKLVLVILPFIKNYTDTTNNHINLLDTANNHNDLINTDVNS
jgi:hypothetical protein